MQSGLKTGARSQRLHHGGTVQGAGVPRSIPRPDEVLARRAQTASAGGA